MLPPCSNTRADQSYPVWHNVIPFSRNLFVTITQHRSLGVIPRPAPTRDPRCRLPTSASRVSSMSIDHAVQPTGASVVVDGYRGRRSAPVPGLQRGPGRWRGSGNPGPRGKAPRLCRPGLRVAPQGSLQNRSPSTSCMKTTCRRSGSARPECGFVPAAAPLARSLIYSSPGIAAHTTCPACQCGQER